MLDKANTVYTKVKNALGTNIKDASQTFNPSPSSFPFMFFNQIDNPEIALDLNGNENAISPSVEITIYTNDAAKLTTGKKVAALVDSEMRSMGFRRAFGPQQVINVADTNICRIITRYSRVFGNEDTL